MKVGVSQGRNRNKLIFKEIKWKFYRNNQKHKSLDTGNTINPKEDNKKEIHSRGTIVKLKNTTD